MISRAIEVSAFLRETERVMSEIKCPFFVLIWEKLNFVCVFFVFALFEQKGSY